jgi:hypothetical protein
MALTEVGFLPLLSVVATKQLVNPARKKGGHSREGRDATPTTRHHRQWTLNNRRRYCVELNRAD